MRSPEGSENDRDTSHKHAIRLTEVKYKIDELNCSPIIDISWDREDALPFPLCLWETGYSDRENAKPVSIARANTVLVDHGYEVLSESLTTASAGHKFRPALSRKPLDVTGIYNSSGSAHSAFSYNVWNAKPTIYIMECEEKDYTKEEIMLDYQMTEQWRPVMIYFQVMAQLVNLL